MSVKDVIRDPSAIAVTLDGRTRATSDLDNGLRNEFVQLRVRGQLDISVAGTGLRNRGSILGALIEAGLQVGGKPFFQGDPRLIRFMNETLALSPLPATRAAGAGIQAATQLEETIWLQCALRGTVDPNETKFLEDNINSLFQAYLVGSQNPLAGIIDGAPTGTVTNVSASVLQVGDVLRGQVPTKLSPYYDELVQDVVGANPALKIDLRGDMYVAGYFIQADSAAGERADILQSVQLRGDKWSYVGERTIPIADLQALGAYDFGGAVVYATATYVAILFTRNGRLSNLLHPAEQPNIRLVLGVQPGAAASPKIRVGRLQYRRTATTQAPIDFAI